MKRTLITAAIALSISTSASAVQIYFSNPDLGDYRVTEIAYDNGTRYIVNQERITYREFLANPQFVFPRVHDVIQEINRQQIPILEIARDTSPMIHNWLTRSLPFEVNWTYWQANEPYPTVDDVPVLFLDEPGYETWYSIESDAWDAVWPRPLTLFILPRNPAALSSDLDGDGTFTAADLDYLDLSIRSGEYIEPLDFWLNGSLEFSDRTGWLEHVIDIKPGDANADGRFNSTDLVQIFAAGQYEDQIPVNSTWSTGDFTGEGEFDSGDLVVALATGTYGAEPAAAIAAVPEPSTLALIAAAALCLWRRR